MNRGAKINKTPVNKKTFVSNSVLRWRLFGMIDDEHFHIVFA
jgi:hypothetical protein